MRVRALQPLSIRRHLALLVAGTLAPVILLLALFTFLLVRNEQATREQQLQQKAQQLASSVDRKFAAVAATLNVLGRSSLAAGDDFAQFYNLGRAVLAADEDLSNLMLASADGEHLVNLGVPYGAPLPALPRPDLPRATAVLGRPLVSDLETGVISGQPLTAIYVPVEQNGQVKYVIGAALELSRWEQILRNMRSPGIHSVLLDANSRVISTSEDDGDEPLRFAVGGAPGSPTLTSVPEGLQKASKTSALASWTVLSYVSPDEVHSTVLPYALWVSLAFAVATLSAFLIAMRVGRSTAASIRGLVDSVKTVASGGSPEPIDTRIREIGEAQTALNETAASLAQRIQEASAARAELQQMNESKMDFLAALGHELRSPLGAIRNALQVAQRTADPKRVGWAHRVIDSQSTQMTRLVDDLFDVSRVDRGKVTLCTEDLELSTLVTRVLEDTQEEFLKRKLTLQADVAPVWVKGDEVRLVQVLSNLLHNAMKFTPAGGKVQVRLTADAEFARLSVADTGQGIAADALSTIFHPFQQGRNVSKEGGLGLGLALVLRLVELHGGSVVATSDGPGRGTTFTVTLPKVIRPAAPSAPSASDALSSP